MFGRLVCVSLFMTPKESYVIISVVFGRLVYVSLFMASKVSYVITLLCLVGWAHGDCV